jgi:phosphoglycolate phosphatase
MVNVLRPIPGAQLRLLVFDLDGTLIDSREDLGKAVNRMLAEMGRTRLPLEVIASYIGDGAGMLVRRALGDPANEAVFARGLELFLAAYREHLLDHTYVYDGVLPALEHFQALELRMAVLTNKPVAPARILCQSLALAPYFFAIYGGNSFGTKKPDPEGLLALMREAGAAPEETLMIGDSEVDVLTARAAGCYSLGCTYGLSPHTIAAMRQDKLVDAVCDRAGEWPQAVGTGVLR